MSDAAPPIPLVEGVPITDAYLVDRTRIVLGRTGCMRARYREYHSGPTGYGIRRKASSLPLVTGNQVHRVTEQLVRKWAENPSDQAVRNLIRNEADAYRRKVAKKGLLEIPELTDEVRADLKRVVEEQASLIEAMGWALHRVWLPELLAEWEPVLIEEELTFPLGPPGVILMNRPDFVMRRRIDGALAQFEWKTVGGWLNLPAWRKQWETSPQLMLTKSCIERRLGQPVSFAYLFAMDKGKRSEEKATGQLKQWTHFLYAYHREANPPMWGEDWQLHYEWTGAEDGKSHRLGKGYTRVATYQFGFGGLPEGMTSTEFWMRAIEVGEIQQMREVLGPYDFQPWQQEALLRGVAADEVDWIRRLGDIWEAGEKVGWDEAHPDFQAVLDERVPQSWNCHQYGKDCPFLPICKREPGMEAPHADERFELRRPHHEPEIQQMIARGIEPPEDEEEDEAEPA